MFTEREEFGDEVMDYDKEFANVHGFSPDWRDVENENSTGIEAPIYEKVKDQEIHEHLAEIETTKHIFGVTSYRRLSDNPKHSGEKDSTGIDHIWGECPTDNCSIHPHPCVNGCSDPAAHAEGAHDV